VVRGLTNWGVFHMPKATKGPKGSTKHHVGHYYVMRFDASPKTQHMVRRMLGLEPRLLRFSCVRLGRTLRTISKMGPEVEEWSENSEAKGVNIKDDDLLENYR
jgi:small subunit ribosomal protein S6